MSSTSLSFSSERTETQNDPTERQRYRIYEDAWVQRHRASGWWRPHLMRSLQGGGVGKFYRRGRFGVRRRISARRIADRISIYTCSRCAARRKCSDQIWEVSVDREVRAGRHKACCSLLHTAAARLIVYNYTFFITICSHYRQAFACFDKITANISRDHIYRP